MSYHRLLSNIESPCKPSIRIKTVSPWWVKIMTDAPKCVYYFGPFDSQSEAIESQCGYLKDLMYEEARGISVEVNQDSPQLLTISE